MASNWGRVKYDECNYNQDVKMSVEPGMYNSYLRRFENDFGTNPKVVSCPAEVHNKIACELCDLNKNAVINNNINALNDQLLDIDSELKLYLPQNSKCANKKYIPNFKYPDEEKKIVVTPKICDRLIVPTNMKMPENSGLFYPQQI